MALQLDLPQDQLPPRLATVAQTRERLPLREAAALGSPYQDVRTHAVRIPVAFQELFVPSRYKAYYGGRGSAKSHSLATALLLKLAQQPLRWLCCREIQVSIRDSVKRLLDDKISDLGLHSYFKSTDSEIVGANGSLILFAGLRSDPYKVKSTEGLDGAWVEEANTVSQRSLDLLIPTVRGLEEVLGAGLDGYDENEPFREGDPEIWFSWNPGQPTDPVDAKFRGKRGAPHSIVREVSWRDNPWFPRVLRAELEHDRKTDPEKFAHIWDGAYWSRAEARVFKNWRVGNDLEFNPVPSTEFKYGGDWGFAMDPTVLVRSWVEDSQPAGWTLERSHRKMFIDQEVWAINCEIDDTPALFQGMPGADTWPIVADSARPETISYMQNHGFPRIVPAHKGPGSVEEGVKFLQAVDEIIVHPRCVHTIDELRLYSYKTDALTGRVLPILEDKKNHVIDSLRYAYEGFRGGGFWCV